MRFVEFPLGLETAGGFYLGAENERVLLQCIEVIDAYPGRAVQPFISRMLIAPSGTATMLTYDLEYVVHTDEVMREYGLAFGIYQDARQLGGIDLCHRFAGRTAAVETSIVDVNTLGEIDLGTESALALRVRCKVATIKRIVIVDARHCGRAAGHLRDQAGKRIGGIGGECVRIKYSGLLKRRHRALLMGHYVIRQIHRV